MSAHVAREVALIVNPSAGGGRAARALPAVEARLRALGVDFEVDATRDLDHARALAVGAAQHGRVVVTLSGDGMLGAVAGALRQVPGAVVGVLPGGRGNDFARVVGIPLDPEAACDVIASGVARPIDLGLADEHPYIGIASVGFDSEANRIANAAPARLGRLVYVYGALGALVAWKHAAFTVEVDGERTQFSGWSVAAANSKAYGGGMFAAPDAELDDGALDVVYCERTSKAHFVLELLPKIFKGEHVHDPSVHVLRGAEVRVDADRPFMVYADGDPVGELPMTFRALPAALQVLLPSASAASPGAEPRAGGTRWA
jgi:YegS/Rv2252/BmrU family lipid kinase